MNKDIKNIYKLDGKVPIKNAIPYGLQHVLAMFIANIAPIIIICGIAKYNGLALTSIETATLIQNAMIIAGIGTLIQLYPIWKVGSKLPIVMGISFTFVSVLVGLASNDYGIMIGATIIGGIIEGILGLTFKYWKKLISPLTSACVVLTIGISLLPIGIESFGSSSFYPMGSMPNIIVATFTLLSCLLFQIFMKGPKKQLNVLFGLVMGYIFSLIYGMVDFNSITTTIKEIGIVALPKIFSFTPKFDLSAIISVTLIYLVSAAETIGDTTAISKGGLNRNIKDFEISGSLACDGFLSAISSGVFNTPPITSFSQNVGLVSMTKVVNRYTIMFGALILIIAGLFPPIGAFFSTLPDCVLGGCTVMMFGTIIVSGIKMLTECDLTSNRNITIIALSLSIGIGITQVDGFFTYMPKVIQDIFSGNPVAGVFLVATILELLLPKKH